MFGCPHTFHYEDKDTSIKTRLWKKTLNVSKQLMMMSKANSCKRAWHFNVSYKTSRALTLITDMNEDLHCAPLQSANAACYGRLRGLDVSQRNRVRARTAWANLIPARTCPVYMYVSKNLPVKFHQMHILHMSNYYSKVNNEKAKDAPPPVKCRILLWRTVMNVFQH